MKGFMKKNVSQKIISLMIVLVLFNFIVPKYSYAGTFSDLTSSLLAEVVYLVAGIGDVVMGALNHMMLGTTEIIGSSMLDIKDVNVTNASLGSYLCPQVMVDANGEKFVDTEKNVDSEKKFDGLLFSGTPKIPNFLYSPENIFANKIAALDVNFLKPHTFTGVEYEESGVETIDSGKKAKSAATVLTDIVASWYRVFRRIAIVGLLSVLVYVGIRIMISATAADKAKYKESLKDWLIALILVVVIHYIMAGFLMFTENITYMISKSNNTIVVNVPSENVSFRTNMIGYVRFMAQSKDFGDATAFTLIYLVLVIYTGMFTITYLKRFLYMAFFTMISPLVALTYPIDKLRDGKAQAFDMWFKEYTMNLVIQPVHLILYTVLISSASELAVDNPIYACVAIAFLLPAEKFIKKMFGLDKAQTTSGLGEIAGGALAMQGIKMIGNAVKGKEKAKSQISGGKTNDNNIRQVGNRGASSNSKDSLAGFLNGENSEKQNNTYKNDKLDGIEGKDLEENSIISQGKNAGNFDKKTGDYTTSSGIILPGSIGSNYRIREMNEGKKENDIPESNNIKGNELSKEKVLNAEKLKAARRSGYFPSEGKLSNHKIKGAKMVKGDDKKFNLKGKPINMTQEGYQSQWKRDAKAKAKKATHALGTSVGYPAMRKIKNTFSKEGAKKALKATGRGVYKVATKGAGMAVGATALGTAAIAAGMATGDFSKAASMAAGGIALGAGVGASVTGRLGENAKGTFEEKKKAFEADYYGKDEMKRREQARFDKNFVNSEENYQYLYKQGLNNQEAQEFLESAETRNYLESGVTDIATMYKTHKLRSDEEHKDKGNDYFVSLAQLASKQSSDYATNYTSQNSLMDNLGKNGVKENDTKSINKDLIKILG